MTIDSTGSIDLAGEHLARFIDWLHTEKKIDEVDLVGHSMGGLYARAAIRTLMTDGSPVHSAVVDDDRNTMAGFLFGELRRGHRPIERLPG